MTYGAFYVDSGLLRAFALHPDGDLETRDLTTACLPHDAHLGPTLGLDRRGRLHLFGGGHGTAPAYFRMARPGRLASLEDRSDELAALLPDVSYPMPLLAGSDPAFWLLARAGSAHRGTLLALRWDEAAGWQDPPRVLLEGRTAQPPRGPYINAPLRFPDGRVAFALLWRSPPDAQERIFNSGFDYLESADGFASLRDARGRPLPLPLGPESGAGVLAVPPAAEPMNQAGACVLDSGWPVFASLWRAEGEARQIHLAWSDGSGDWPSRCMTDFVTDSALSGQGTLPQPHSRPALVPFRGGRLLLLYRSRDAGGGLLAQPLAAPNFDPDAFVPQLLAGQDLGFYEPVADRDAGLSEGRLKLYLQRCDQTLGGDEREHWADAPAHLAIWDEEALFQPRHGR